MESAALKRYVEMIALWQRIQTNIHNNLKALVIILDKFLLFAGTDSQSPQGLDTMVERIINSYAKDRYDKEPKTVNIDQAMALLARIKETPQKEVKYVTTLTANVDVNLPGTIALFLQRQSDKMLQIICEVRTECQTFKDNMLPKMQQVYDASVVQLNRRMLSIDMEKDNTTAIDAIYNSFGHIAEEVETLIQLVASLDIYPVEKPKIQEYIYQISNFKMTPLDTYRTIISEV